MYSAIRKKISATLKNTASKNKHSLAKLAKREGMCEPFAGLAPKGLEFGAKATRLLEYAEDASVEGVVPEIVALGSTSTYAKQSS
jgi:hypothetical protein